MEEKRGNNLIQYVFSFQYPQHMFWLRNKKILFKYMYMLLSGSLVLRICVHHYMYLVPGRVARSVTCLATDACLTAVPGVVSSIPARSHTFVELKYEIISTGILLTSAESFKKDCCQLQAEVCALSTG